MNIDDLIKWNFDNSYYKLPKSFREEIKPVPVKKPEIIILNENLSKNLGLNFSKSNQKKISNILSGNILPKGSNPIAQAYAGHQFGHFTMLGDGRAVLIGEHISKSNKRFDIQLKGSGKTSFSRSGDGRAALGPMLREYIISEALHFLNIPTTRSLAVVKTGEEVFREEVLIGAILTRIASSHIRVGTFQYIAARQKKDELEILVDYVIDRHYPNIKNKKNKALDLLKVIMEKQINLVINWMRVGFIHGVMNTDNMTVSGESIDFGPCAFMDTYNSNAVFSSIDQFGRYSFSNQPKITKWNITRFAECLIPLIDDNENKAIDLATEVIEKFENKYQRKWLNMMREKLGMFGEESSDKDLIDELLRIMETQKLDYTNTFCYLMNIQIDENENYRQNEFIEWKKKWLQRLKSECSPNNNQVELMRKNNPIFIPRNYHVEKALKEANKGKLEFFQKLLHVIERPYKINNQKLKYINPGPENKNYRTFCGT